MSWKNANLHAIYDHPSTTPYLRELLHAKAIEPKRNYLAIDVKVQKLRAGVCTCLPGWHTDTVVNLAHDSRHEIHQIFATSTPTEFIATPLYLHPCDDLDLIRAQIELFSYDVWQAPPNSWVQYTHFNYHRGPVPTEDGARLLVRVTHTDLVKPTNQPWKPAWT